MIVQLLIDVLMTEPEALSADEEFNDVSCYGYSDASIYVDPVGGSGEYTYNYYQVETGNVIQANEQGTLENIGAGTYLLIVTDSNGCEFPIEIEITEPIPIEWTVITDAPPCPGEFLNWDLPNNSWTFVGGNSPANLYWFSNYDDADSGNINNALNINSLTSGTYYLLRIDGGEVRHY